MWGGVAPQDGHRRRRPGPRYLAKIANRLDAEQ